jgi:hypothetical protein
MAINFLNTVDFNKNQLDYASIQNLGSNPSGTAVEGQIYFNTQVFALMIYANGSWVEVGATSGVETFTTTQTGSSTGNSLTVLSAATGAVTVNSFAYAGGSNVGYVPAGGAVGKYLDGAGNWLDVTTGDIESVNASTVNNRIGIAITNPLGPDPTVGLDIVGTTALGATPATGDKLLIYDVSTTTNKSITVGDLVGVTSINFKTDGTALNVNSNTITTSGTMTGIWQGTAAQYVNGEGDLTTFPAIPQGDITQVNITAGFGLSGTSVNTTTGAHVQTLTVGQGDGITVSATNVGVDSTVVRTTGAQSIAGLKTFTDQVTIPTTPSANASAASKQYVDQSNVGQSIFQGGYNAATNTPDLDVSPSNLIKKGWFWAVTNTGVFFMETVQPGDLIYANQDNPGNNVSNWVIVQSGQDIATAGASDGATVKGIAGFNSAHFSVTANGWVSSDIYGGGSTLGIVPSGGAAETFLNGDGSWATPTGTYVLPVATTTVLGGVKIEDNTVQTTAANTITTTASRTYGSQLNSAGQLVVNVPWLNTEYIMMTSSVLGLGKLFSDTTQTIGATPVSATASRTYGIQKNSSNQLVVNVPWVDTNTQAVSSVSPSSANGLLGMSVTPTTGAVVVGLNINGLAAISTLDDADTLAIYDGGINKKISLLQLENHIGAAKSKRFILNTTTPNVSQQVSPPSGTIGWVIDVNTSLGVTDALDCMVEIIATTGGGTVYAEVTRTGTAALSKVTINFSGSVSQGAYQALVTRIY